MTGIEPTELRIPDVGALTAETLLQAGSAVRVAGDATSSFWRPRAPQSTADGARVEVFTWDTRSTGLERALWMLMFPFTLLNIAHFARPLRVAPDAALWRRILLAAWRAVCRLLALGVTATVILGLLTVAADLVAWRCFDLTEVCGGGDAELSALFENVEMSPGRRLGLALAVPALFVAFVAWVAERSWRRYEVRPAPSRASEAERRGASEAERQRHGGLADPTFWDRAVQVTRLRHAHVLAARSTALLVVVDPVLREDRATGSAWAPVGVGIMAAAALMAVIAVIVVAWPGVGGPIRWDTTRLADRVAWGLGQVQWPMTGVVMVGLAYLLIPARHGWVAAGPLASVGWASRWLFLAELAGVAALFVLAVGLILAGGRRSWHLTRYGLAGPMLAAVAVALSTAACAAITYLGAQMLQGRVLPPLEALSQDPLRRAGRRPPPRRPVPRRPVPHRRLDRPPGRSRRRRPRPPPARPSRSPSPASTWTCPSPTSGPPPAPRPSRWRYSWPACWPGGSWPAAAAVPRCGR